MKSKSITPASLKNENDANNCHILKPQDYLSILTDIKDRTSLLVCEENKVQKGKHVRERKASDKIFKLFFSAVWEGGRRTEVKRTS